MHDREDALSRPTPKTVIVQAITRLNIGGPGRHVLAVAAGLEDRYSMRVAAGHAPEVEGELAAGRTVIDRLPLVRSVDVRRDLRAAVAMRQLLRRHDARLVHSHMAKAGAVARIAAASMPQRPRIVHTFHGHVLAGYFSPRTEAVFADVERRLARRSDLLITVSADVRDALLDLGIGRPAQYEVLPLGVDLAPYLALQGPSGRLRASLGLDADRPLVGVVARLAPVKDHATLLEAMAELPGVHLAILGDGDLRPTLEAHVARLGLDSRVHFTRWWNDMPGALADVDVVALTSRNEGTPMALIEAAAAAKATVATDVGGVSDVVLHGRTGLLAPPRDATSFAHALRELLDDPVRRARFGSEARRHVEARFSLDPSLHRLADLYDDLLVGPVGRNSSRHLP